MFPSSGLLWNRIITRKGNKAKLYTDKFTMLNK